MPGYVICGASLLQYLLAMLRMLIRKHYSDDDETLRSNHREHMHCQGVELEPLTYSNNPYLNYTNIYVDFFVVCTFLCLCLLNIISGSIVAIFNYIFSFVAGKECYCAVEHASIRIDYSVIECKYRLMSNIYNNNILIFFLCG